jgi:hypothetical protein
MSNNQPLRCLLAIAIIAMSAGILSTRIMSTELLAQEVSFPPKIPGGKNVVTDKSKKMLVPVGELRDGVVIAKTPPTVDFMYYGGQDYATKLWSAWGDNLAVGNKCYSAIGDHDAPEGNAFLYSYDAETKELEEVVDLRKVLKVPAGKYTPAKIHSRIDLGSDGWLYFSTHRGSTRTTIPENGFTGGWILRYHPEKKTTEIVAHAPLAQQTLPTSILDPDRLIFYAGTADGTNQAEPKFLAYDIKNRKVLYSDDYGPYRYAIFAKSTGQVYFHGSRTAENRKAVGPLVRFDPEKPGQPVEIKATLGLRTASEETRSGKVYTADRDNLWEFDTKSEKVKELGPLAVASKDYITSIDLDRKTERYLYYVPGAHGGSENDGSPLVQYDLKTKTRKVIVFLHPYYHKKYDYVPGGCYGVAVSPAGDKVYITWNGARGVTESTKKVRWNTCAFMVVHIPESERQ